MPSRGPEARHERGARVALAVLVVWLFREALFGGSILYWRDVLLIWYPQIETFVRSIAAGSWPVWNPSISFGQPLLADPGAQILYPPTWLNLLLRPWHYVTFYAVAHMLLGALGMFGLAREWKVSTGGALVAAALWTLSGPYVSFVDLWHHFAGASWLPVVLLGAERALSRRSLPAALGWALAQGAQILAGSADMCALTVVVLGLLILTRHVDYSNLTGARNRSLLWCAAGSGGLALLLGAGLWLPAFDIVSRSSRSALPDAVRTYWSVHPLVLLELLTPGIWSAISLSSETRRLFFESREPFLASLYLGAPAAALVGAAFAGPRHELRRFLGAVGFVALLVALGRHAPFYAWATFLLPPLRLFRYPVKVMVICSLCWCLLAGIGFDAWGKPLGRKMRWALWVAGPLALVLILDLALAAELRFAPDDWARRFLAVPSGLSAAATLQPTLTRLLIGTAFVAVAMAIALFAVRRAKTSPVPAIVVAALAVADLAAYHRHPNPMAPLALAQYRPEILASLPPGRPRLYVYDYTFPDKAEQHHADYALSRQPTEWDPSAAGSLAMQMYMAPESIGRWGLLGSFETDYRGLYPLGLDFAARLIHQIEGTPAHLRLLQLGGVTQVVALHESTFADLTPRATIPGLFERPIRVFDVPSPRPRTYAVSGWQIAPETHALDTALRETFDPSREVVLSEGSAREPSPDFTADVRVVSEQPDRVSLRAHLSAPGCVVLLDTYDPGWKVWVNGAPRPLVRANAIFRGVMAGTGDSTIEFVYRPRPLIAGVVLSGLTALLMVSLGLLARRPRGIGRR